MIVFGAQEALPHRQDHKQQRDGNDQQHQPHLNGRKPAEALRHTGEHKVGNDDAKGSHGVDGARNRGALAPLVKARGNEAGEQGGGAHEQHDGAQEYDQCHIVRAAKQQEQCGKGEGQQEEQDHARDLVFDVVRIHAACQDRAHATEDQNDDGQRGGKRGGDVVVGLVDHRGNKRFEAVVKDRAHQDNGKQKQNTAGEGKAKEAVILLLVVVVGMLGLFRENEILHVQIRASKENGDLPQDGGNDQTHTGNEEVELPEGDDGGNDVVCHRADGVAEGHDKERVGAVGFLQHAGNDLEGGRPNGELRDGVDHPNHQHEGVALVEVNGEVAKARTEVTEGEEALGVPFVRHNAAHKLQKAVNKVEHRHDGAGL